MKLKTLMGVLGQWVRLKRRTVVAKIASDVINQQVKLLFQLTLTPLMMYKLSKVR